MAYEDKFRGSLRNETLLVVSPGVLRLACKLNYLYPKALDNACSGQPSNSVSNSGLACARSGWYNNQREGHGPTSSGR